MMTIFQLTDSVNDESLFVMKGFRKDIIVEINGQVFNLFFIDQHRFLQELDASMEDDFFLPETNTIVVKSVHIDNIIAQIIRVGENAIHCMMPCTQDGERYFFNLSNTERNVYLDAGWCISFSKKSLKILYTSDL